MTQPTEEWTNVFAATWKVGEFKTTKLSIAMILSQLTGIPLERLEANDTYNS